MKKWLRQQVLMTIVLIAMMVPVWLLNTLLEMHR